MGLTCSAPCRGPQPVGPTRKFVPQFTKCKVIRIIDGDTVEVQAKLHKLCPTYTFTLRLARIDCPELKSNNADEKRVAELAKNFTSARTLNQTLRCVVHSYGTYRGRLIADLFVDDTSLSSQLIMNRLAVPYDGRRKMPPRNWVDYYNRLE